jgi:hypothetical protein
MFITRLAFQHSADLLRVQLQAAAQRSAPGAPFAADFRLPSASSFSWCSLPAVGLLPGKATRDTEGLHNSTAKTSSLLGVLAWIMFYCAYWGELIL